MVEQCARPVASSMAASQRPSELRWDCTEPRPVCQCVGGCVCVHKGERGEEGRRRQKKRGRADYLMLTSQFLAIRPDGPVWPLIPQAIVQVSICLHTHTHKHSHILCVYAYTHRKPNAAHRIEFIVWAYCQSSHSSGKCMKYSLWKVFLENGKMAE